MPPYAEVIGDPIAHSKSPAIHNFWLECLGIEADYRATLVTDLDDYFSARHGDPDWRGCNVTAPHKAAVLPFLNEASPIGAVNCIVRDGDRLIGLNTDVDGVTEALAGASPGAHTSPAKAGAQLSNAVWTPAFAGDRVDVDKVVLIGAGGAAKAARAALAAAREIVGITRRNMDDVGLIAGATLIINATPLGMVHAGPMPDSLLAALPSAAPGATAFDMVYEPLDTAFVQAARAAGLRTVDGLTMLIGQARQAFRLFFGAEPPAEHDARLRNLLIAGTG
jgi:shikimate dehydrogenase